MRDIRDDLSARRQALVSEYSDVFHRLDVEMDRLHHERRKAVQTFERERGVLDAMIALEARRLSDREMPATAPIDDLSLRDRIVTTIQSRGPIEKDELKAIAEEGKWFEGGRVFNMTLQNILASGVIKKLPDGQLVDGRPLASFFGNAGEAPMTQQ